jgi:hypothetical protein
MNGRSFDEEIRSREIRMLLMGADFNREGRFGLWRLIDSASLQFYLSVVNQKLLDQGSNFWIKKSRVRKTHCPVQVVHEPKKFTMSSVQTRRIEYRMKRGEIPKMREAAPLSYSVKPIQKPGPSLGSGGRDSSFLETILMRLFEVLRWA